MALGLMLALQKPCEWSSMHDCLSATAITCGAAENRRLLLPRQLQVQYEYFDHLLSI